MSDFHEQRVGQIFFKRRIFFQRHLKLFNQECSNEIVSRTQLTKGTIRLTTAEIRSKLAHVHQTDEQHVENVRKIIRSNRQLR